MDAGIKTPDNFGVKVQRLLAELNRIEAARRWEVLLKIAEAEERAILGDTRKA